MENIETNQNFENKVLERLENIYYEPTQTYELYDPIEDVYYNVEGQVIKDPDIYLSYDNDEFIFETE